MSEREALAVYSAHAASCTNCQPQKGQLCDTGFVLHEAWRKASQQQPSPPRRPPRTSRRQRNVHISPRLEVLGS